MQKLKRNEKYVKATTFGSYKSAVRLTLNEMYRRFEESKKVEGLSPRTIDDHSKNFMYMMRFLGKDLRADQLSDETFFEYKAHMIEKGYSPYTVNIRLRSLKTFLRFCYKRTMIDEPFHENIKLVRVPVDTVKSLTDEEIDMLLDVFDTSWFTQFRDKVITIVLLDTMCRVGELMKVKRSDVDLKRGTIYLEAENVKVRKGRTVPLSDVSVNILSVYMEETEDFNNEYLFLTYQGKQLNEATYRKALIDYGRKAGIKENVYPHKLRHTAALGYTMNGGDPFSLQKILGHKDLTMTRRYIQMNDKHIVEKHNQFSIFNQK